MGVYIFVIGIVCVNFVVCECFYKAAVVTSHEEFTRNSGLHREAALLNADILVLPSPKASVHGSLAEFDDYDEVTKSLSTSAKQAGVYVVGHLYEKTQCQIKEELIKSSLVFDRQGVIVAIYRKPLNKLANCTALSQAPTFTTDFGVTFGLLMEEDLVLQQPGLLKMKNYVVSGETHAEESLLSGPQFASSWAYVTNANLITSAGVFAGKAGLKAGAGEAVVKLSKDGGVASTKCTATSTLNSVPVEDLSHYIIRPLDMQATGRGYSETVCHGTFCCEFYVKTSYVGSPQYEVSYGLAAFNGIRHYGDDHNIGAQSCSVVACAGLYKRSCALGPNNSTNTHFEKITISGNFTKTNSAQFPLVTSSSERQKIHLENESFKDYKKVTITIEDGKNLLHFGIFGRDYSRDYESEKHNQIHSEDYYDYFFNEDVQELFDYIWIRLRIMIFIVSIYVLEMM